jgi:hypothetical protein
MMLRWGKFCHPTSHAHGLVIDRVVKGRKLADGWRCFERKLARKADEFPGGKDWLNENAAKLSAVFQCQPFRLGCGKLGLFITQDFGGFAKFDGFFGEQVFGFQKLRDF